MRILDIFRSRDRRDADLDEEIRSHLAMAAQERVARGVHPVEAAQAARREFGNVGLVREVTREMWGGGAAERLGRDLQLAARALRRAPVFTVTALLTLALGIGLTTTMFSVADAIVLRPLPFPHADRLVTLCEQYPGATADWCSISPPNVEDLAARSRAIEAIGIARGWSVHLATADGALPVRAGIATPGMFTALGVPPAAGRVLERADLTGAAGRVAVITHEMWQARFGGASDVVGRVVTLDREPVTIVGVMPPRFEVPRLEGIELWRPLHLDPRDEQHRAWRGFVAYARLAPGTSVAAARAELARIAAELGAAHFATTPGWGITLQSLHDLVVGGVRQRILFFLGAVVLVLLVGCANVANLLLARGAAMRRELALRAALGAGPVRLMRGLLLEAFLLSLGGAVLGVALAVAGTAAFRALAPGGIPRVDGVGVDLRVLAFALALAVLTTLVFGLVPSLRAARVRATEGLRDGGHSHTGRGRLGTALVIGELALALVLLTGAGLLTRTFAALASWSPGFDQRQLLLFSLSASPGEYRTARDVSALWVRAADAVRAVPGVTAVGTASGGPAFGGRETAEADAPGAQAATGESVRWFDVSPGFFEAVGVPIVRGRDLNAGDVPGAPPVVLVNETLGRRYWPGGDPLGKSIRVMMEPDTVAFRVVGVVRDVPSLDPDAPVEPQLYWSNRQQPRWFTYFVVRTAVPPASVASAIRSRLAAVDEDLQPGTTRTLSESVDEQLVDPRFSMLLLVTFGACALVVATVGTYGLLAYVVSQRRREIGIRLALGAWPGRVRREVLRSGLALALGGLALGGIGSLALGRTIEHLVAGVSPRDPLTLAAAAVTLLAASLAACLIPAWRASRISPLIAMKAD